MTGRAFSGILPANVSGVALLTRGFDSGKDDKACDDN